MEDKFFVQLKEYLLKQQMDNLPTLIPYYETLLQMKDQIGELLEYAEKYEIAIEYAPEGKDDYYSYGCFMITFFKDKNTYVPIPVKFEINLEVDERNWNYCTCKPSDEGYNSSKECCGDGCDWDAPSVSIYKIEHLDRHNFDGVENQLWELEKKWEIYTKDYNDEIRKAKIERLEDNIKELLKQKEELMNT